MVVEDFAEFDEFAGEWKGDDETTARMRWQLLGEMGAEAVLVKLPEWLAEEKVGYTEGSTPTVFVGRIETETKRAIRLAESASPRPLMRLTHRIARLEEGLESADADNDRRAWLDRRLEENRRALADRSDAGGPRDEWVPKSQILLAARRRD